MVDEIAPPLLPLLHETFAQMKGTLSGMREQAWSHFLRLGLPSKKEEAFSSLPLHQLYEGGFELGRGHSLTKEQVASFVDPESRHSFLLFVNGVFEPALSDWSALPPQVVILPLGQATRSYGNFLQNRWSQFFREERDPFVLLNLALHPAGIWIYIPPKQVISTPVHCLFLGEGSSTLSFPLLHLCMGAQSEMELLSTYKGNKGWMSSTIDLLLETGSRLRHVEFKKSQVGWHLGAVRATLKRDSSLIQSTCSEGGGITRHSTYVKLAGENSSANLQGLSLLQGREQNHTHVVMEHQMPHTHSLQNFKEVIGDTAQAHFEGKIFIHSIAQKSEAFQRNSNLLIGEYAQAYSRPNLEIFADDVKASHGATISQLNKENLFYITSRGIPPVIAKKLLIDGFCREVLDPLPFPLIRNQMLSHAYLH